MRENEPGNETDERRVGQMRENEPGYETDERRVSR